MKLIQLPTQALEERIQEELEVNPALETESQVDEDPYATVRSRASGEDRD
jgi:DNA-directed RNA polymerase specialized sigma54-like protein